MNVSESYRTGGQEYGAACLIVGIGKSESV